MNFMNYFKIFSVFSVFAFVSCDLSENSLTDPPKVSAQPAFNSSYSVLWATKTVSTIDVGNLGNLGGVIGDTEIEIGLAFAGFVDGGKFVPAGNVTVDNTTLKMQSNNTYINEPTVQTPQGIEFSGNVKWVVDGNDKISAINHSVSKSFPTASGFEAAQTVDRSTSYTLSLSTVTSADSIVYMVNDVVKTVGGSVKSVTFTPEELSKLKKGAAFAQVAPYNYEFKKFGKNDFVFGNQIVLSKLITIK